MILFAVLGLLFIAMIVFAVMSARKDWHWLNPVLLVFIFIAGSAAMIGMGQTLHLRRGVLSKLDKEQKRVVRAETQRQELLYGDMSSSEYGPKSLRGLSQQNELLQLGRGRVWSGHKLPKPPETQLPKTIANVDGEIEFKFPAEQPEVEDESMSLANVELFAFSNDANGTPVEFVGKFLVVEQTQTELFLKQSVPIANWQEYRQPQATSWTLFERMPFDKHGIYRDLYEHQNPDKSLMVDDKFDISTFRNYLTAENSPLSAANLGMQPNSAQYERLIDEFTFDGVSIGEIDAWVDGAANRVSPRFEPAPTEVFIRYKFNGNSTETYTVDDKTGKLDTDGTYTIQGHAVDPLLHLSPGDESRDVTFKKDDIVEIDLVTSEGYQRAEGTQVPPFTVREPSVKEVGRFYRRKLVDFPYEMTKIYNRFFQSGNDKDRLFGNNEVHDTALADLMKQQQERTREKVAYENDNNLLRNDLDRINSILQQRERQVADNAQKIETLQRQLDDLRRSIELRAQRIGATSP